mgnify:CR=1 FL=1
MLEMKIQLSATDALIAAVQKLAAALECVQNPQNETFPTTGNPSVTARKGAAVVPKQMAAPLTAPVQSAVSTTPPVNTAPSVPVNPTPTPIATPAQTVPVATPAPAVTPAANVTPAPAVPTSAPQYTLDMIATAGSALIDAGKMDQLMQLLGKFGVASLTELSPENYGAMATDLRALGAAI